VTQIHDMTVLELSAAVREGQLSPVEVTDHYLDRIDRLNEQTGAFYTVTADLAREQAKAAEKLVAEGRRAGEAASLPALTGMPIPIKDLNMVAGIRMTLGSTVYADFVPDVDDNVVVELRKAGIVITGKTSTPEFGLPCYTETRIGPPARTPWDLSRSVGGSSGGRGPGPSGPGQRRWRLDPDPVQRVRPVRDQAKPGPDLPWPDQP
jgi:amidase